MKKLIHSAIAFALVLTIFPFTGGDASAYSFGSGAFERTWARTDAPVAQGHVNRTWMWGPSAHTAAFYEPYHDAPGGTRLVQYTDKSRMENNAYRAYAPWDVTNGRLAYELITGRMQLGDAAYQDRHSAQIQVAGDNHPDSPTYASFNAVRHHEPVPNGWTITQTIDRNGHVGSNSSLGQHGVTAQYYVSETNHTVASVFWNFMNSSGSVFENGQYRNARLFENPFFATGYPITEAYWMHVPVAGQWRNVLAQCFERRCLTYTPGNPAGWQVEAGNIGQHYYRWRYGDFSPGPGPTAEEIAYVQEVVALDAVVELSFIDFVYLLDHPTLTNAWYRDINEVFDFWNLLPSLFNSFSPPAGYEHFHERMFEAFIMLSWAADDLRIGINNGNNYYFNEGFAKLDAFFWLYDDAVNYFSDDSGELLDETP